MNNLIIKTINSLNKVYLDTEPSGEISKATMLSNEKFNYQIAVCSKDARLFIKPTVISDISESICLYKVGNVASELPAYANHDDNVERTGPGLFPDPLYKLGDENVFGAANLWYSIWVCVDSKKASPGIHKIEILICDANGNELGKSEMKIEILSASLPKQELIYTNWFHTDCLSSYYNVSSFSQKHWNLIREYMSTAAEYGMNMILTPLFTPPLDTAFGGERPTAQLIDVFKNGRRYTFDFTKLKKWIRLAKKCGIKYLELSHLFTQWGAGHAPKIMAYENGMQTRIFGWETDASGEEYSHFLSLFLPALILFIKENKLEKNVFFHVSDEPSLDHFENYKKASSIIKKYVKKDFPVIDALSKYEFYKTGLVDTPIPATNHFMPFYENGVKDLWTYYCCSQYIKTANRFFSMPSARNRILGFSLYKYDIKGFLHWGFNFWYTQYSTNKINPYLCTDAGGGFPSGDSFVVYPGEDLKPVISLRLAVFAEALQDLRALQALEAKIGREKTIALIEKDLETPISFTEYPRSDKWLIEKREEINELLR